jgi:hypothetical protein
MPNMWGLTLDRDLNAARNILALGLERALTEAEPLLIHRRISKFGRGSERLMSLRCGRFTNPLTETKIG